MGLASALSLSSRARRRRLMLVLLPLAFLLLFLLLISLIPLPDYPALASPHSLLRWWPSPRNPVFLAPLGGDVLEVFQVYKPPPPSPPRRRRRRRRRQRSHWRSGRDGGNEGHEDGDGDENGNGNGNEDFSTKDGDNDDNHCRCCCTTMLLVQHIFGYSYGQPYVGVYRPPWLHTAPPTAAAAPLARASLGSPRAPPPPSSSHATFDTVTLNLTVTSSGRQFDRLALVYLGDVEIFRTSTAEPTATGIVWRYSKDVTAYLSLWQRQEEQKLIFDLGNLIDDTYTGSFNVTLTATFCSTGERGGANDDGDVDEGRNQPTTSTAATAAVILPISAQRSAWNASSAFVLPGDNATATHTLPTDRHISRALVSLAACGQATEEFWYSNVFSQHTRTFLPTTGKLYGASPFREVQLYVDDMLAGVAAPFPVIFTGGIAPGFWRPVVGIDAFDLREPEIDITPFIPYLTDGRSHEFRIRVVGFDVGEPIWKSGATARDVGSYWVASGKIFLFFGPSAPATDRTDFGWNANDHRPPSVIDSTLLIEASSQLTQTQPKHHTPAKNETLAYAIELRRLIRIAYPPDAAPTYNVLQDFRYRNDGLLSSRGLQQVTNLASTGTSTSLERSLTPTSQTGFEYGLLVNTTFAVSQDEKGFSIDASLDRRLLIHDVPGGPHVSLYTLAAGPVGLHTTQWGDAHYRSRKKTNDSYSFGETGQSFWQSSGGQAFARDVMAVNGSVVRDRVSSAGPGEKQHVLMGGEAQSRKLTPPPVDEEEEAEEWVIDFDCVRALLGRGPGRPRSLFL